MEVGVALQEVRQQARVVLIDNVAAKFSLTRGYSPSCASAALVSLVPDVKPSAARSRGTKVCRVERIAPTGQADLLAVSSLRLFRARSEFLIPRGSET